MDRLKGVRARFIYSDLVIHGERYRCYYITDNPVHDYVVFWLHKRYTEQFKPIYFIIPALTDNDINSLFLLVINGFECNGLGKISDAWRKEKNL